MDQTGHPSQNSRLEMSSFAMCHLFTQHLGLQKAHGSPRPVATNVPATTASAHGSVAHSH